MNLFFTETTIDAIDAGEFGEMAIHRKLAPYQCAFYCFAEGFYRKCSQMWLSSIIKIEFFRIPDDSILSQLKQLARLLQLILEKAGVTTLDLSKCEFKNKTDLDQTHFRHDAIGIPYSVLLDARSLETGFLKLRNRDTTIHETVHISRIEAYLVKIFNSYKNIWMAIRNLCRSCE